jgi:hypothetical protein
MVLLYGEALGNAVEARRLYTERFPNRTIPDSRTFSATVQRVGDHRKFDSPTHDLGGPRSDHVFEIELEILQAIEEEPKLTCFMCQCFHFYCLGHVTSLPCPTCLSHL